MNLITASLAPSAPVSPILVFRTRPASRLWLRAGISLALLPALYLTGCKPTHNANVVATVNGHAIMRADLDKAYAAAIGGTPQDASTPEQGDTLRLNALRQLIDEEIVEQRAAKMNLTATNEDVDAKLLEMKAPYTEDQFNQQMRDGKYTLEDLRRNIRRTLTIGKLLNKEINSKVTVTDADITSYYNQHKSEFNLIEPVYHLAQIQVTNQPSAQPTNLQGSKATNDDEARKKIQALRNRLETGEDFGTIAMNFSERPETASSGGDMGFVTESSMKGDPATYNTITRLKNGQITEILPLYADPTSKAPVGYSIYKLISREPAGQRDLNDPRVQQNIRQQLHEGRSQLLKNAYFEMLRDQSKVENFFAEQIFKNDAH